MKRLLLTLGVFAAFGAVDAQTASSDPTSTGEMVIACSAQLRSERGERLSDREFFDAGFCSYYFAGVRAGLALQDTPPRLKCVPTKLTNGHAVRIFQSYASTRPSLHNLDAASVLVMALADAFPCGKQ